MTYCSTSWCQNLPSNQERTRNVDLWDPKLEDKRGEMRNYCLLSLSICCLLQTAMMPTPIFSWSECLHGLVKIEAQTRVDASVVQVYPVHSLAVNAALYVATVMVPATVSHLVLTYSARSCGRCT